MIYMNCVVHISSANFQTVNRIAERTVCLLCGYFAATVHPIRTVPHRVLSHKRFCQAAILLYHI